PDSGELRAPQPQGYSYESLLIGAAHLPNTPEGRQIAAATAEAILTAPAAEMAIGRILGAATTASDSQYFISSGVRRSLSSQMNGVNQIPATIVQEGQADIQTTLNLNQLYSPKFEVPANSRLLNIQPPIQVPIEVQPL